MKILFLTPPLKAWDSHGLHKAANQMHAQAAAYVRSKGIAEVMALDCRADDLDWDMMLTKIGESKPDMVFLGDQLFSTLGAAVIWYFNEAMRMVKAKYPSIITVASGLWYSADYERQMRLNPFIDYILIGEAELTLEDLVNNLKIKSKDMRDIPGLVSRRDQSTIIVGPHRDLIPDLKVLPPSRPWIAAPWIMIGTKCWRWLPRVSPIWFLSAISCSQHAGLRSSGISMKRCA